MPLLSNTVLKNSYLCQQLPNLGMMPSVEACFLKKWAKMEATRTSVLLGKNGP